MPCHSLVHGPLKGPPRMLRAVHPDDDSGHLAPLPAVVPAPRPRRRTARPGGGLISLVRTTLVRHHPAGAPGSNSGNLHPMAVPAQPGFSDAFHATRSRRQPVQALGRLPYPLLEPVRRYGGPLVSLPGRVPLLPRLGALLASRVESVPGLVKAVVGGIERGLGLVSSWPRRRRARPRPQPACGAGRQAAVLPHGGYAPSPPQDDHARWPGRQPRGRCLNGPAV